ncbi:MAG: DNA-3-methyladenine glycosylase 2 family protein [Bacteroidetes bacterium]|nr:DNA-3-methyladenine glycosylase 2 family protein [Bacteroidota bacterium]
MPNTLFKHDEEFYEAVKEIDLEPIQPTPDYFNYLLRAIAFQQVSGTAGATIHGRFLKRFTEEYPSPEKVLDMEFADFREAGLSGQKSTYMQNIARFWIENQVTDQMLSDMLNADLIAYLTQIKGVGKWTAEMLMIFGMGREDVFPLDDLGIQQGFAAIFGMNDVPLKELKRQMGIRSVKWSPHRSCAARLIWAWKDRTV